MPAAPDTRNAAPRPHPIRSVLRVARGAAPTWSTLGVQGGGGSSPSDRPPRSGSTRAIWLTILALGTVDALWVGATRRNVALPGLIYLGVALGILLTIARIYHRTGRSEPLARAAQAAAQLIAFSSAQGVYMYLVTSTNAPTADALFARADHAIGFDWVAWTTWVQMHRSASVLLAIAYDSMIPQMVLCAVYLALRRSSDEFLWTIVLASVVTISMSAVLPAVGNLPHAPHVPHFLALRSGALRRIDLRGMQGLVAFPSFHAAVAVLLVYAVRRQTAAVVASAALNAAMLVSTVSVGGHYLIDVLAGVAVAGLAIALAHRLDRPRGPPADEATPHTARGASGALAPMAVPEPDGAGGERPT